MYDKDAEVRASFHNPTTMAEFQVFRSSDYLNWDCRRVGIGICRNTAPTPRPGIGSKEFTCERPVQYVN
jgi:hypothetical protein